MQVIRKTHSQMAKNEVLGEPPSRSDSAPFQLSDCDALDYEVFDKLDTNQLKREPSGNVEIAMHRPDIPATLISQPELSTAGKSVISTESETSLEPVWKKV